jgi:hypothetical protein
MSFVWILKETPIISLYQTFLLRGQFWLRKTTTYIYIFGDVNLEYADDRYPKLDMYIISEMILESNT